MANPIEMPKPGVTVEECLLVRWLKRKGESVAAGEPVAEIETDKATFEVSTPSAGTMLETFFAEGELVPVYTNLCVVGEPGESVDAFRPAQHPAAAASQPAAPAATGLAAPARTAPAPTVPASSHAAEPRAAAAPPSLPANAPMSPRARRFAEEHRFQPAGVRGSGAGGRILEADVRRAYFEQARLSPTAAEHLGRGYEIRGEGSGIAGMVRARDLTAPPIPVVGVREKIARRMRESLQTTAQYTLTTSADASGLLSVRARIKAAAGALPDVNINEMVMFCAVKALTRVPDLNAEFFDGKLYRHSRVHIGFACDTPRGLLVPVVKNAEGMSIGELAARVKALTKEAIDGSLALDDMTGATFTVSNLGNLGIESFTPILNPPQVAILGVNAIDLRPVRREGKVEFVDRIGFSLTLDHQVVDGAPGARFLVVLRECVESVEALAGLNL